jgi:hypothetical protein
LVSFSDDINIKQDCTNIMKLRNVHTEINVLNLCSLWIRFFQRLFKPDSVSYGNWFIVFWKKNGREERRETIWDCDVSCLEKWGFL